MSFFPVIPWADDFFDLRQGMNTLIVGLGSPHGEDQLGWLLIDELKKCKLPLSITLFKSKGSATDWFHELTGQDQLIFLDAALSDEPPGSVIEFTMENLNEMSNEIGRTSHSIHLYDSIVLARNIGMLNIPVLVVAVSIGRSDYTDTSNIERIFRSVMNRIHKYF